MQNDLKLPSRSYWEGFNGTRLTPSWVVNGSTSPNALEAHSFSEMYLPISKPKPRIDDGTLYFKNGGIMNYINYFKKGGKSTIHIKEKNKGKFTKSAKAAGEGVQEHAHKVMNNPNATTLQKRRANFAIQAKRWAKNRKRQDGGTLNYLNVFK